MLKNLYKWAINIVFVENFYDFFNLLFNNIDMIYQQRWMDGGKKGFYIVKYDPITERPIRDKEGKCIPVRPGELFMYEIYGKR